MFPRTALVILAFLITVFIALFVRGAFVGQKVQAQVSCTRGIEYPYQKLLTRMRELADAGETAQLRLLIIRAQERSGELGDACSEQKDDGIYAKQIREITR
jgi:hypothetical protein